MLFVTCSLMKRLLFLAAIFATSLHAETEAEFIARITTAWESKDSNKVIALYGDPQKLDPEFIKYERASLDLNFKTCRLKSAYIVPFLAVANIPQINEGVIYQLPPGTSECISIEIFNEDEERKGSFRSMIPIIKDKDGNYSYATPVKQSFEWKGPRIIRFGVRMSLEGSAPGPEIIVVVESCGYTTWQKIRSNSSVLRGHKILQIIVPPTLESKCVSFEISKDDAKPFFKKTIDTSKGAIIPIESITP